MGLHKTVKELTGIKSRLTAKLGDKLEAIYPKDNAPRDMADIIVGREVKIIKMNERYTNHPS